MLDQGKNQCGYFVFSYVLCRMELLGKRPDWNQCNLNTLQEKRARRKSMKNLTRRKIMVCPKEFYPGADKNWKGLSFGQWLRYVMSDKVERPSPKQD